MATIYVGWGVQGWGTAWGGYVIQDQPSQPIGDFSRWERVSREHRFPHEPATVRNVLFAVQGVSASAEVGKVACSIGSGIRVRLRRARTIRSAAGAVGVQTGWGTEVALDGLALHCDCGKAEAGVSIVCEPDGVMVEADIGRARVRAVRNPTDEEFLMMLAEAL